MDFTDKKLPKEAIHNLISVGIEDISPYSLLFVPTYIFLKENEKFIAVRAPLDFFTESDLEKLRSQKYLYFHAIARFFQSVAEIGLHTRTIIMRQNEFTFKNQNAEVIKTLF